MANSDEVRWQQRLENFGKALAQLEAACSQDVGARHAVPLRDERKAEYLTEPETETLLDALAKRNVLSHTYEEANAKQAERLIKGNYAPVFRALFDRLNEKRQA